MSTSPASARVDVSEADKVLTVTEIESIYFGNMLLR